MGLQGHSVFEGQFWSHLTFSQVQKIDPSLTLMWTWTCSQAQTATVHQVGLNEIKCKSEKGAHENEYVVLIKPIHEFTQLDYSKILTLGELWP